MPDKIVFDCERMKYPNTGLYQFCLQLGKALYAQCHPEQMSFYLPEKAKDVFGTEKNVLLQHSLHKFFFPLLRDTAVWHSTFQGTMYYPASRKVKIVATIHDLNFLYEEHIGEGERKRNLERLQLKINRADHIVGISQFVLNDLKKHLSVEAKPMSVIYNGCYIEHLDHVAKPQLAVNKPFLFTIGTIAAKKNFHVLPSLLVGNDWSLVIAGIVVEETYKQRIIDEAQKHGVSDRVIFTGGISENDKKWYLENCLAFTFPSIAEGFGLPVIEAMYFGKPTFLSTSTALPEIGGKDAYYFEYFDPESMRETLSKGLAHYKQTSPSELIKKHAASFSWEQAAQEYMKVYRSVMAH